MIRYTTAGESHGQMLVGILEGVPAGLDISASYINNQLRRRKLGYGRGGRMKIETDEVTLVSGVRFGRTLGSPIALMIQNNDWKNWTEVMSVESSGIGIPKITLPRPGHADYAGSLKYGFDDIRNVIDRASARETAMRVACCTIVRKVLEECGVLIASHVLSIGRAECKIRNEAVLRALRSPESLSALSARADSSEVRMLDPIAEKKAIGLIKAAKKQGDTLGGVFEVIASGLPIGLGSYVHFDRRLDAQLVQALVSIQAVKGAEVGAAFELAKLPGSQVHDELLLDRKGNIVRPTNHAGGLEGGVTNGQPIILHAAMKPISTLAHPLRSVDLKNRTNVRSRYERSDVCALPACAVIGEAVIAPVLANAFLEKFGGDSMKELQKSLKKWAH
ncbi:MAG: chorismate synthase [Ignavibacteriales bacterium]|nr:chorismate synthase [Ignavibacteriales bacterium]